MEKFIFLKEYVSSHIENFFFYIIIFFVTWGFIKIRCSYTKLSLLDDKRRAEVYNKILEKYNNNNLSFYTNINFLVLGTKFFKVESFYIEYNLINIYVKTFSIIGFPTPFTYGYAFTINDEQFIASFSKEDYKKIKSDIREELIKCG